MNELLQAEAFYKSLTDAQKKELQDAIAENIYFLDDNLQREIIAFLDAAADGLGKQISMRNSFTT